MASTKYTYSIADDTANGAFNTDAFKIEYENSAIITALDYVETAADVLDVWTKDTLSSGDETIQDGLIAAHTGVSPIPPEIPVTSDGRPIYSPNLFRGNVLTNFVGVDDDIANGIRYGGDEFLIESSIVEEKSQTFQFRDQTYFAGGGCMSSGGVPGDWMSCELFVPATVGTSNPGAGAYDKYDIGGGANMFIPNATTEGDWDLNLTEKENANVDFMKVRPVPSADDTGYFDWNTDTEAVTLNAGGAGGYNLFDFDVTLGKFVQKVPLFSEHIPFIVPAVKPKKILGQWKFKVTVNNSTAKSLSAAWFLYLARVDIS